MRLFGVLGKATEISRPPAVCGIGKRRVLSFLADPRRRNWTRHSAKVAVGCEAARDVSRCEIAF